MTELPLYKESLAMHDYTEMNIEVLERKYYDLDAWLKNPETTTRQRGEIERIMGHLVFEITMRKREG